MDNKNEVDEELQIVKVVPINNSTDKKNGPHTPNVKTTPVSKKVNSPAIKKEPASMSNIANTICKDKVKTPDPPSKSLNVPTPKVNGQKENSEKKEEKTVEENKKEETTTPKVETPKSEDKPTVPPTPPVNSAKFIRCPKCNADFLSTQGLKSHTLNSSLCRPPDLDEIIKATTTVIDKKLGKGKEKESKKEIVQQQEKKQNDEQKSTPKKRKSVKVQNDDDSDDSMDFLSSSSPPSAKKKRRGDDDVDSEEDEDDYSTTAPFECKICIRSFSSQQHLSQHLTTLSHKIKKKPYLCKICSKRFVLVGQLKVHQIDFQANGGKPFGCNMPGCQKAFCSKTDLKAHLRFHQGKFVVCPKCPKKFPTKATLANHRRIAHPVPGKKRGRKPKNATPPSDSESSSVEEEYQVDDSDEDWVGEEDERKLKSQPRKRGRPAGVKNVVYMKRPPPPVVEESEDESEDESEEEDKTGGQEESDSDQEMSVDDEEEEEEQQQQPTEQYEEYEGDDGSEQVSSVEPEYEQEYEEEEEEEDIDDLTCRSCGRHFVTQRSLARHMTMDHVRKGVQRGGGGGGFECSECDMTFPTGAALRSHSIFIHTLNNSR